MARLRLATCQFPVSGDSGANCAHVARQLQVAKDRGADVAHFPEGALSGYAGSDFDSFEGFDWDSLREATDRVLDLANRLGIWVVLGSAHPLSRGHKPHNCIYVIDSLGQIVDRYDKRFCGGDPEEQAGDLAHYSPGDHLSEWEISGIRCGAVICYDYRYPELYREYKRRGIDLVFHSFHAANAPPEHIAAIGQSIGPRLARLNPGPTFTYPGITMPATMIAAAASNHVWISCPNSSAPESMWAAFVVRADGIVVGRLRRNVPGVVLSVVDTEEELYDSTAAWRGRAMAGVLHSGRTVDDPRSRANRRSL